MTRIKREMRCSQTGATSLGGIGGGGFGVRTGASPGSGSCTGICLDEMVFLY
jgi:hypothetical protein